MTKGEGGSGTTSISVTLCIYLDLILTPLTSISQGPAGYPSPVDLNPTAATSASGARETNQT